MLPELIAALEVLADPLALVLIFLATMLGMFMGILPGLGGTVTIALLIPLTFGMDPLLAFMLLAAAKGGTNFGGSVTAILLNTPGATPNAATILDGYPMARSGEGGRAIGASAMASASGAIIGILLVLLSIPIMVQIVLLFGPPEIFWLALVGIALLSSVVRGDTLAGLISGVLGLLFAMHGFNNWTANVRWDYGFTWMMDGIHLVPALIGLFALSEIINLVASGSTISTEENVELEGQEWTGVKDVVVHKWLFLRSALIGTAIGTVPGAGGAVANFVAYFQAVKTSKNGTFGKGDVRGVIASEASNDGKDAGMFLPTLAFGIPGSASTAVLLGAFLLHGIQPGPNMIQEQLDLVMVILLALILSNLITSTMGLLLSDQLVKITKIDIHLIAPIIVIIVFFGSYATSNIYGVWQTLVFGLLGYAMIRVNMSRVPLILALVLGPLIEINFWRAYQIGRGDPMIFARSPLAVLLIVIFLVVLFLPLIRRGISKVNGSWRGSV